MCRVREEDMEESVLQSVSIDIPVFCPLNAYPLQILFKNIYECIVHSVLFAVTRYFSGQEICKSIEIITGCFEIKCQSD